MADICRSQVQTKRACERGILLLYTISTEGQGAVLLLVVVVVLVVLLLLCSKHHNLCWFTLIEYFLNTKFISNILTIHCVSSKQCNTVAYCMSTIALCRLQRFQQIVYLVIYFTLSLFIISSKKKFLSSSN